MKNRKLIEAWAVQLAHAYRNTGRISLIGFVAFIDRPIGHEPVIKAQMCAHVVGKGLVTLHAEGAR